MLRTGEDPTTLPSVVLAVVVDGLFGVFVGVSGAWDELFIGTRPPPPTLSSLTPIPNKSYMVSRARSPTIYSFS